jgi:hypothetical protein
MSTCERENPYQLPVDGKWYFLYRKERFGPYETKEEAERGLLYATSWDD